MRDIHIRLGSLNDLSSIMIIVEETVNTWNKNNIYQWNEVYPRPEDIQNDIENNDLYVAINDQEEILGFIVLNQEQADGYRNLAWTDNSQNIYLIHRMVVSEQHRSQGVATKLYIHAEKIAKLKLCTSIRIDTAENNKKAQQFFINNNFKFVGIIKYLEYGHLYSKYNDMNFYCYEKLI